MIKSYHEKLYNNHKPLRVRNDLSDALVKMQLSSSPWKLEEYIKSENIGNVIQALDDIKSEYKKDIADTQSIVRTIDLLIELLEVNSEYERPDTSQSSD